MCVVHFTIRRLSLEGLRSLLDVLGFLPVAVALQTGPEPVVQYVCRCMSVGHASAVFENSRGRCARL
jgi:hypothetical protein